jgi:hypothetical protein
MAGLDFDDLVPGAETKPSGKPQGMSFDDLIPVTALGNAKAAGTGAVKFGIGNLKMAGVNNPIISALDKVGAIDAAQEALGLHKAENPTERYWETGTEFGLGALGPGGLAKQAFNLLKGGGVGVVTEGAGQLAERLGASEGVQRAVRFATGLAGGVATSAGSIGSRPRAPTHKELEVEKSRNYKTMETSGSERTVGGVSDLPNQIRQEFGPGFDYVAGDTVKGILKGLEVPPSGAVSSPVTALDAAVKLLRNEAAEARSGANPNLNRHRAATLAANRIDDFIANPTPETVAGSGGMAAARVAAKALEEGRGNAGAAIRSEGVTSKVRNAEVQNDSNQTSNFAGVLKKKIDDYLVENKRGVSMGEREGFNPEELARIDQFVGSGKVAGGIREWANVVPLVGPLIGKLATVGQGALAKRAVDAIDEAIRMRSPLYSKKLQQLPPDIAKDIFNALRPAAAALPNL